MIALSHQLLACPTDRGRQVYLTCLSLSVGRATCLLCPISYLARPADKGRQVYLTCLPLSVGRAT